MAPELEPQGHRWSPTQFKRSSRSVRLSGSYANFCLASDPATRHCELHSAKTCHTVARMKRKRQHRRNYNEPGHAHELTFSCYHGFKFLQAERTCEWLRDSLNAARTAFKFDLWAFVFMPEHVHIIVHPRNEVYDIAAIRQAIKELVGRKGVEYLRSHAPEWLEKIRVVKGDRVRHHFWQAGGGYDRNAVEPRTLMQMIEYIHLNPVRRGLVTRAIDWKWSSANWYEGNGECPIKIDPIPRELLMVD